MRSSTNPRSVESSADTGGGKTGSNLKYVFSTQRLAMPIPYSTDLRWRVVWLSLAHHYSSTDISKLLNISSRTVERYLELFSSTGDVLPAVRRNGPARLLDQHEQLVLLRLIIEVPGIYLSEIQQELHTFGIEVSVPTICRTLRFMGCSRQRIQHIALQRSDECRARFMAEISIYDPSMFVWIDETGCDQRNGVRKHGYSIRGIPPCDYRLLIRGTRYSAIPVMSMQGIHDVQVVEGTVNGDRFKHFIEHTVLPILNPFDGCNPLSVVIMDNCSIHHIDRVVELIESIAHAKLIFLPPYSPDLMPLEEVFSKVKAIIKANDSLFQVQSLTRPLIVSAFSLVTTKDCVGYVKHSGYVY